MMDYNLLLKEVESWVRAAGKVQKENLGRQGLIIKTKSSPVDLLTEIDRRSEEILLTAIRKQYPSHGILSEEYGEDKIDADYRWVIDPLDGTTNYAQGLPIFTVSVALQFQNETVLGVVYAPILDAMFTAIRGQGAFLNGQELKVSDKQEMDQCVFATGFPYDRAANPDNNADYFAHFVPRVRGLRRMGAASFDLACVAAGTLDGYWEFNLKPWDVAAGSLLVEEAGGYIVDLPHKRGVSLVAGSEKTCRMILEQLAVVDKQRKE